MAAARSQPDGRRRRFTIRVYATGRVEPPGAFLDGVPECVPGTFRDT
jgi:hypothetical protein